MGLVDRLRVQSITLCEENFTFQDHYVKKISLAFLQQIWLIYFIVHSERILWH
ncbi:hypothetical protein MBAV_006235 [Candidatus Magnetobacterium bavaricum]|uniref:Uncharacterized protein n=1 Tax=Candidatus Magnetobacterium bavaricum TaxID=29290 RepID=A0A0F3GIB8_9BACT|nr:hypothetical protein MBAV_006235 [Candidatus Magnetobacterium bavaricum]